MGALVFIGAVTGGAAIVIGAIVISVAIGFMIDFIEKETGATDGLENVVRSGVHYLENKMPSDYGNYGDVLQRAMAHRGIGA